MKEVDESIQPKFVESIADRVTALTSAGLGTIPFSGSILAQLVGTLAPEQRLARIEAYIRYLELKVDLLTTGQKELIKTSFEHIDLFEEGAYQAIRAITDERRQQIAQIVAEGLSGEKREAMDKKRVLLIFSQLDDENMIILLDHVMKNRTKYDEFVSKHAYLLEPLYATAFSDPPLRERAALRTAIEKKLRTAIEKKLERFGLIKETLMSRTRGVPGLADQMIESDKNFVITELGRIILHEASLINDEEYALPARG